MKTVWLASAPANIALIKYMGKTDASMNLPANASFSYTLENCRTFVEVELKSELTEDAWEPLIKPETFAPELSDKSVKRFLQHVAFMKQQFNFDSYFIIRSANNFPSDCGLASSASSFAALTLAMAQALAELTNTAMPSMEQLAQLSQQASGSSCRSFFSPWCLWQENSVKPIELPYQSLLHQVIIVDKEKKSVSSSEAHRRVVNSALYQNRPERAEKRLDDLLNALNHTQWQNAYEICWQEFWDMHALFETAKPPFGYMTSESLSVLNWLRDYWNAHNEGPIITMDAGANVHCLFREDQATMADKIQQHFSKKFTIIASH